MKDKLLILDTEVSKIKLEFKEFIANKANPLDLRVLTFDEAPAYMKETAENVHLVKEKLPKTWKYMREEELLEYRNEVVDISYQVCDTLLFVFERLKEKGIDYKTLNQTIFNAEFSEDKDVIDFNQYQQLVQIVEELLHYNIGYVVNDV